MAHLKDLIVNGASRFLGRIYAPAGMEGTATKAEALTTNAGSTTLPVFFENGVPKAITSYSGKATSAGTADVATKLGTASVGSTSEPIYLNAGVPTKISYKIEKSVPSNAVFTDTTYSAGTGLSLSGTTFNHSNSVTAITTAGLYKVKYDAQGHITGTTTVAKSDITGLGIPGSDTTYSAGTGLSLSGTTFNHSNSITAVTTAGLYKVKYDAQGHITGTTAVAKADITGLGIPASDTTYSAEKGISLTSGKFGHSNTAVTAVTTASLKKVAYDAYGHITSTSDVTKSDITALGIPGSDTNTDTKVNVTLNTTTKAYLLGTTTTPTATAAAVTSVADTGVYLDTTAGSLTAGKFYATSYTGYAGKDNTSTTYSLVADNGANFWIGASGSTNYHHKGGTFISTGWSGTLPTSEGVLTGNSTLYVSVPKYTVAKGATTGTWSHTAYDIIHAGNYTSYITPANIGAATSDHTHSTYVLKTGDTMTGSLTLGTPNRDEIPTVGITVQDIRNATNGANSGVQQGVNFYFTNAGSPSTGWWSIMHVRGWTASYSAWELAGPSHNADQRTTPLYVRTSNAGTAWGSWRKIYDSSNPPTAAEVGAAASDHSHAAFTGATSSTAGAKGMVPAPTTDNPNSFLI